MNFRQYSLLALAGFLFASAPLIHAQFASTGAVLGQVKDPSGGVVQSAEVVLIDTGTKTARKIHSNNDGRYSFNDVVPGNYDLTVTSQGFAKAELKSQQVDVGQTLTLDVALTIGTTATTVQVEAAAGAELQTSNSTVGSTLSGDSLLLLPNLGRDASSLVTLQVGVTPGGQVGGTQSDQSSFHLDGGNNSDDMAGTYNSYTTSNGGGISGVAPTPVESIEEFQVGVSNQTADFNGAAGAQVQMVTKRGTSTFHGALYDYYFGTDVGAANTWKNDHTPSAGLAYTPLANTHKNRFGAALGGPVFPKLVGKKTFFFVNYEGFRFPNNSTIEKSVPTALLRAGVIQVPNSAGVYQAYNLNPFPVTVNGTTYQPTTCAGGSLCDPRGIGLNPIVNQIWTKYMPMPNDPQGGDRYNTQGYTSNVKLPVNSDFGVIRLDRDLTERHHFFVSDRYYSYQSLTSNQIDIGGALPGDTFGQAAASAPRPQYNNYLVAGLTSTLKSNLVNDFRFNVIRNYWSWSTLGSSPQLPGLGGAVEIGGESSSALIPYNVDTGSTRARAWDGHDQFYRDDLNWLVRNHQFQFGGSYQRDFDYYTRNDNGIATDSNLTYQIGNGTGIAIPSSVFRLVCRRTRSRATRISMRKSSALWISRR